MAQRYFYSSGLGLYIKEPVTFQRKCGHLFGQAKSNGKISLMNLAV